MSQICPSQYNEMAEEIHTLREQVERLEESNRSAHAWANNLTHELGVERRSREEAEVRAQRYREALKDALHGLEMMAMYSGVMA